MEIRKTGGMTTNHTAKFKKVEAKAPSFGEDRFTSGSVEHIGSILKPAMEAVFQEAEWVHKWPGDFKDRGLMAASDGSLYAGDDRTLYKLNGKTGKVEWKKEFRNAIYTYPPGGEKVYSSPVVEGYNGEVYVRNSDGGIRSIDPATGDVKWKYRTSGRGGPPVVTPDGTVYSQDGRDMIALNPWGTRKYRFKVRDYNSRVRNVPRDDIAIVASPDKGLFAIDANGRKKWHMQCFATQYFPKQKDRIYTMQLNDVAARDIETGAELWKVKGRYHHKPIEGVTGDRVLLKNGDDIECLDASDGNVLWKKNSNVHEGVMLVDKNAVYTGDLKHIKAIDVKTGEELWKVDAMIAGQGKGVMTSRGAIYVNDEEKVMAINAKTGRLVFRFKPPKGLRGFHVSKDEKTLYVQEKQTSNIYAFDLDKVAVDAKDMMKKAKEQADKEGDAPTVEIGDGYVDVGGVKLDVKD